MADLQQRYKRVVDDLMNVCDDLWTKIDEHVLPEHPVNVSFDELQSLVNKLEGIQYFLRVHYNYTILQNTTNEQI